MLVSINLPRFSFLKKIQENTSKKASELTIPLDPRELYLKPYPFFPPQCAHLHCTCYLFPLKPDMKDTYHSASQHLCFPEQQFSVPDDPLCNG